MPLLKKLSHFCVKLEKWLSESGSEKQKKTNLEQIFSEEIFHKPQ